jgi:hypothetical protein
MKPPTPAKRKQRTSTTPAPLRVSAIALTRDDLTILSKLAQEQSDLLGRAISRSTLVRALIRFAERNIAALELRAYIEVELQQGRKWGHDSTRRR